jgi:hypothetical protein
MSIKFWHAKCQQLLTMNPVAAVGVLPDKALANEWSVEGGSSIH